MGNNAAGYEELLIVMEWCPAGVPDLLQDRGGVLNRADTIKVFYQVAGITCIFFITRDTATFSTKNIEQKCRGDSGLDFSLF